MTQLRKASRKDRAEQPQLDWRPQNYPESLNWFESQLQVSLTRDDFTVRFRAYLETIDLSSDERTHISDDLIAKLFRTTRRYLGRNYVLRRAKEIVGSKDWKQMQRVARVASKSLREVMTKLKKLQSLELEVANLMIGEFVEVLEILSERA